MKAILQRSCFLPIRVTKYATITLASLRSVLFLIFALGVSSSMRAQNNVSSWSNLSTLREGEKIQVREMSKTKVVGTFVNFSETAITVKSEAGPTTVERLEIRTVKRMKVKHRWVHSLILAGAGAGIGYGVGRSQYHPCAKTQSLCLDFAGDLPGDVGLVGGLLGGAVIGAALPIHETVYSVSLR
jgi:hypothetical protein